MTEKQLIDRIMIAQAELQVTLGWLRLKITRIEDDGRLYDDLRAMEIRLTRALAEMHSLLNDLGRPMYDPARHPEVPYND